MLERFLAFNAERAAMIKCEINNRWGSKTLLELAHIGLKNEDQAYDVHDSLLSELQTYKETPVVYVVDEHNEIWRYQKQNTPFFLQYTGYTGLLQGSRTFVLISGSAHSAFEFNLQPGLDRWIRRIQPFPRDIFEKVISPDGVFALPANWQKDARAKRVLEEATGRIPREMEHLKRTNEKGDAKTPMEWVHLRTGLLRHEFNKFLDKPENQRRIPEFRRFLEIILSPRYITQQQMAPSADGQYFYDTGLIYHDQETRRYKCTCLPAERVVLDHYYSTKALTPISYTMPEPEQGLLLEDWIESQLFRGATLPTFPLSDPTQEVTVEFPAIMLRKFFSTKEVPRNETGLTCFYVPSVFNFPGWDLVIHDPRNPEVDRLLFIQHSINSIRTHDKKKEGFKIAKTFESRIGGSCLVQDIVSGITGKNCHATISEEGNLHVSGKGLEVLFLYITGKEKAVIEREEIKAQNERDTRKSPQYCNLLIIPREVCTDILKIPLA
jgi:hypothetical protein